MRSERAMKVLMMVGFVVFMTIQFMPSSAQTTCWQRILTCVEESSSADEFQQKCCAPLLQEITNERECFCSVKPILLQNATLAGFVSRILSFCTTTSFNTFCPGDVSSPVETPPPSTPAPFLETPCWKEIDNCVANNAKRSEEEPRLNPSSPTFNVTEFFCCPLMQQTAVTEKQCFCSVNTFVQQNPSAAPNITFVLSACNIADSSDSLNRFCLGGAPASNNPPTTQSVPQAGLLKKLNEIRF